MKRGGIVFAVHISLSLLLFTSAAVRSTQVVVILLTERISLGEEKKNILVARVVNISIRLCVMHSHRR